jgi:superfamily II DNA or RNA helicase
MRYEIISARLFILLFKNIEEYQSVKKILEEQFVLNKRELKLEYNKSKLVIKPINLFTEFTLTEKEKSLCPDCYDKSFLLPYGIIDSVLKSLHDNNVYIENKEFTPTEEFYNSFFINKNPDKIDFSKLPYQLRYRQDECIKAIATHKDGIIDATTAFGKSWIISFCCKLFDNKKIGIVSASLPVCNMLHRLISRVIHPEKVGLVAGYKNYKSRVTVYSARSLHKSDYDEDLLFIDEIHQFGTEKYAGELMKFEKARIFGFSASVNKRFDGGDKLIFCLAGKTIFKISYEEARGKNLVSDVYILWHKVTRNLKDLKETSGSLVTLKRKLIWSNLERNKVIADISSRLFNSGLQVLILVETIEHCLELKKLLPEFEVCYGVGNISSKLIRKLRREGFSEKEINYLSSMSKERLERLMIQFEKKVLKGVIATSVWSCGVSFDGLDVLVRADGVKSSIKSIQVPGRVCRIDEKTGKNKAFLIDFVDDFDERLRVNTIYRFREYKNIGFKQYNIDGKEITKSSQLFD